MFVQQSQLKDFLLDSSLVSKEDVLVAEKKNPRAIGQTLVNEGKLSLDDLHRIQGYILGIPFINLRGQKIDFDTISLIPEPIARSHNIVAFKRSQDVLEVAMLDTDDLQAIDFIKKKVGLRVLPRLTDSDSMRDALLHYQKSLRAEFGELIQTDSKEIAEKTSKEYIRSDTANETGELQAVRAEAEASNENSLPEEDLKKLAEDLPVIRIVDTLLKHAILQSASDIHIEPMEKQVLVRYRIDGILRDAMVLPKTIAPSITARIKVLSNLKLDEKRLPQDGRFKIDMDGQRVAFRVSMLPTYFGEKTVMRLLREGSSGFTLEALGFSGVALEAVHKSLKATNGMILTTGPTGSGKTSTLYTMLDILNTPEVNISTIEDPIEYQMARINQTQVRPEIDFTFSVGLRSLVRQDPDIIMVGEIRDTETASLAVNAALTGHLVLSTLHTNSAAGAIPRLVDMQVEPFLLVSTLNLIIAQRLVRKTVHSDERRPLQKEELEKLGSLVNLPRVLDALRQAHIIEASAEWADIGFGVAKPNQESKDGYHGRMGIYEALAVTPSIKDMIIRSASADELHEQAQKEGMLTMAEDGIYKAAQGITTIEEVLRVIND